MFDTISPLVHYPAAFQLIVETLNDHWKGNRGNAGRRRLQVSLHTWRSMLCHD